MSEQESDNVKSERYYDNMGMTENEKIELKRKIDGVKSAIVADRVFELAQRTGLALDIRPVLPMVMRGLPAPKVKRMYIKFLSLNILSNSQVFP